MRLLRLSVIYYGLAERVGFEPTRACTLPLFESGTFDHSDISPRPSIAYLQSNGKHFSIVTRASQKWERKKSSQSSRKTVIEPRRSSRRDSFWTLHQWLRRPKKAKTRRPTGCNPSMKGVSRWRMGERRAGTPRSLPGGVVVLVWAKLAGITSVLGAREG